MSLDLEPINELHRKIQEKLSSMLKPSGLRIGNNLRPRRVLDPENTPITGYSICAKHLAYSEEELNHDWEGIPLSGEIFEKYGFERDEEEDCNGYLSYRPDMAHYCMRLFINDKGHVCAHYLGGAISTNHPQYLHQLQNLFFALTGEELIIKP
jgi:hypothetical protein